MTDFRDILQILEREDNAVLEASMQYREALRHRKSTEEKLVYELVTKKAFGCLRIDRQGLRRASPKL